MANQTHDWMSAAVCWEGPRPTVGFRDLPHHHRGEMLRFGAVAAASTAYFVTLALLAQPIPSRSLLTGVALPGGGIDRPMLAETRVALDAAAPLVPPRLSRRPQRAQAHYQVAAFEMPSEETDRAPRQSRPERRHNILSRFFRGVWRNVQPAAAAAE